MQQLHTMIDVEQKAKLEQIASRFGVSVAEANRRAIDAFNPKENTKKEEMAEEMLLLALNDLAKTIEETNKENKEIRKILDDLKNKRKKQDGEN